MQEGYLDCCILFLWPFTFFDHVFLNGRIPGTSWSNTDRCIAEDGAHRWRLGKSTNGYFKMKCIICVTTLSYHWIMCSKKVICRIFVVLLKHQCVWLSMSLCVVIQTLSFPWIFCGPFCSPASMKTSVLCSENIWRWLIDHVIILGLVVWLSCSDHVFFTLFLHSFFEKAASNVKENVGGDVQPDQLIRDACRNCLEHVKHDLCTFYKYIC